ncbi:MAG: molybdate ABC transporter substrate-binding protein [Spirochaetaceae bacterium]|jgi:molybdate transport system substrate-binding protein|nr:molybdate ABC transporter substrate-binding protein [Spirochaetaceae bacterium]
MKKRHLLFISFVFVLFVLGTPSALFAAGQREAAPQPAAREAPVTILVAAAASLEYSFVQELIPRFQAKYPWITVEGIYDSSGRLQTQIEAGLEADVFMSAAVRQMNELTAEGFIAEDSVRPLLENKIVLIKTAGSNTPVTSFETVLLANVIALGDPASVPAGQYAREAFTSLGIWDAVFAKASLGTNVTEVLNWVGEGSAEIGVVYATDAATTNRVQVLAEAPAGSLAQKVIYPVGRTAASAHSNEAELFIDFLASGEGLEVFRTYGFSPNN